jgi:hypothetical protein
MGMASALVRVYQHGPRGWRCGACYRIKIRFEEQSHDRITKNSKANNVLLSLERPGSADPFRQIDIYESLEQQEEGGEASICLP